jgi:hypothetical protein
MALLSQLSAGPSLVPLVTVLALSDMTVASGTRLSWTRKKQTKATFSVSQVLFPKNYLLLYFLVESFVFSLVRQYLGEALFAVPSFSN